MSKYKNLIEAVMNGEGCREKEAATNDEAAQKMSVIAESIKNNPSAQVLPQFLMQNPDPALQQAAQKSTQALNMSMDELLKINQVMPNPLRSENETLGTIFDNMQYKVKIQELKQAHPNLFPPTPEEQAQALQAVSQMSAPSPDQQKALMQAASQAQVQDVAATAPQGEAPQAVEQAAAGA